MVFGELQQAKIKFSITLKYLKHLQLLLNRTFKGAHSFVSRTPHHYNHWECEKLSVAVMM